MPTFVPVHTGRLHADNVRGNVAEKIDNTEEAQREPKFDYAIVKKSLELNSPRPKDAARPLNSWLGHRDSEQHLDAEPTTLTTPKGRGFFDCIKTVLKLLTVLNKSGLL